MRICELKNSFVNFGSEIFVVCVCRFCPQRYVTFCPGSTYGNFFVMGTTPVVHIMKDILGRLGFILSLSIVSLDPIRSLFVKTEYSSLGVVVELPGGGCTRGVGSSCM